MEVCSDCFQDEGLRLTGVHFGTESDAPCPNCGSVAGAKLDERALTHLAHSFFVRGTLHRVSYGGAPVVQFNTHQSTSIRCSAWLERDVQLLETTLGVGFFHYAPRLWMVGEIAPLKALQVSENRPEIVERILREYPTMTAETDVVLYRVRINPDDPSSRAEYDSPPDEFTGNGRLDSPGFPVMYASPDLEVCVHECRAAAEDDTFAATLSPTRPLRLLDLTELIREEHVTEFESLDLAVHMLFLAGEHSYEITRAIAAAARAAGYDGIIYPSYFSVLRTGAIPFETSYGLSHRIIPQLVDYEKAKIIPNLALFGRPIKDGTVRVRCLNRVVMQRVDYSLTFGPASVD